MAYASSILRTEENWHDPPVNLSQNSFGFCRVEFLHIASFVHRIGIVSFGRDFVGLGSRRGCRRNRALEREIIGRMEYLLVRHFEN